MSTNNPRMFNWDRDGVVINTADLNASIRQTLATILDFAIGPRAIAALPSYSPQASTGVLFSLAGGGGFTQAPGVNRRLVADAGVILQAVNLPNGTDPALIPYALDVGEGTFDFAIGDAALDRFDLVQARISWLVDDTALRNFRDAGTGAVTSQNADIRRRARLEFSIKQGTPNASPTIPAPDAGYAPWIAVRIPATFNAALINRATQVIDCRYPLGRYRSITVPACNMQIIASGGGGNPSWAVGVGAGASGAAVATVGAGGKLVAVCPDMQPQSRLLGLSWWGGLSGGSVQLVKLPLDATPGAGGWIGNAADIGQGLSISAGETGFVTTANPVWCNGLRCGGVSPGLGNGETGLGVQISAGGGGDYINFVRFHVLSSF